MSQRSYILTTTIIFAVIGVLHVLRLVFGWRAQIGGTEIPMWLSYIAVAVTVYLTIQGYRLAKTCEK
jgi:purine-cytosine permease-like protein